MATGQLKIHSENILPIIKKWLYSDHDIFARELISNATDALRKLQILRSRGETEASDEEMRIDITIDKEASCLIFSDTGIGMTAEEVETYIAQIAFSGAEEFVKKYQTGGGEEQFIGHFGLGFYSAYMVAKSVEIDTLSYRAGQKPAHWICDGSSSYTLTEGKRETRGTRITLHIADDQKEYLDETRFKAILQNSAEYLPFPIYLNGKRMNEKEPLWLKPANSLKEEDYLEFYRHLYPMSEEPLFWIHLSVDYPFSLKGILYFPKLSRSREMEKSNIRLYSNRVFVSESCKEIVPEYLLALRGAIDSPDIPLNVSRSSLQMDRTVKQLSGHIAKKVADSLLSLLKSDREKYIAALPAIGPVIKIGAIEDEKFYERIKEGLLFKTLKGEYLTADAYLSLYRDQTENRILYSIDPHHQKSIADLYLAKGIDILITSHPIDAYLINFLERKIENGKFARIDSSLGETLLDKSRETEDSTLLKETFAALLDGKKVEAKSLASDSLPALLTINEEERRMKEYMQMMDPENRLSDFAPSTLVINSNSPLAKEIAKLNSKNPQLAKELAREVYDLARLTERAITTEELTHFVDRTYKVFEKLLTET